MNWAAGIAAIVGDITPHDGFSDADKFSLEAAAIQKMRETLGSSVIAGGCGSVLASWCAAKCVFSCA